MNRILIYLIAFTTILSASNLKTANKDTKPQDTSEIKRQILKDAGCKNLKNHGYIHLNCAKK